MCLKEGKMVEIFFPILSFFRISERFVPSLAQCAFRKVWSNFQFLLVFSAKVFPFRIHFNSDGYEHVEGGIATKDEGGTAMKGFKIKYFQKSC